MTGQRRPRRADLRAGLLAAGLVILLALLLGRRLAVEQGYEGYLYWRTLHRAVGDGLPWAAAAFLLVQVQFFLLLLPLGYRRRVALILTSGWLAAGGVFALLPGVIQSLAERLPTDRLPVFAPSAEATAAFFQKGVNALLLPQRVWLTLLEKPALWLLPLAIPPLLGLLLFALLHWPTRRWSAAAGGAPRRTCWLAWTALIVLAAVTPGLARRVTAPDASGRPDLVLISIDTLRRDAVGFYNPAAERVTPNLDALARRGVALLDMRAPASWTMPSHASMLTGRYPWSLGLQQVTDAVSPGAVTLAERLAIRGYDTRAVVTHLFVDVPYGFGQGFEHVSHPRSERAAEAVAEARRWLADRPADRPGFLFLHLYDPHFPYDPPPDVPAWLYQGTDELERQLVQGHTDAFELIEALRQGGPARTAAVLALYRAEIWAVDRELGGLLDQVTASGRPTLVVLVSDHGEMFGEHEMYGHGITLFEEEIRVPCFFAGLDLPAGSAPAGPAGLIDLTPTILELLNEAADPEADGISLAAYLREGRALPERWLAGENHWLSEYPARYLSDGRWKWFSGLRQRIKSYQLDYPAALHDLADDPGEQVNVWDEPRAATARKQTSALAESVFRRRGRTDADVELDPAQREKLRSLGYVQ